MVLKREYFMDNRVIIVVWKWNVGWRKDSINGIYRITEGEFCDFIGKDACFSVTVDFKGCDFIGYTKNNKYFDTSVDTSVKLEKPEYKINEIEEKCKKLANSGKQVLLLLHGGNPDNFNKNSDIYKKLVKERNIVVDIFIGSGPIYKYLLNPNDTYFLIDALEHPTYKEKIKIRKENFNNVWNYYYLGLEQKKNDLIKLWLPLAIDIQGLSEVKKSNFPEYLKDICNSNTATNSNYYKHLLVDFWNMMVEQKFKIENGNFKKENTDKNEKSLQTIVNNTKLNFNDFFSPKKENGIDIGLNEDMDTVNSSSPLVILIEKMDKICSDIKKNKKNKKIEDLFKNYISESHREFFFPEWLEKFARKLDEIKKLLDN